MSAAEARPRDWIVAQIGAREHYAVARAFHRQDRLGSLHTDAWGGGLAAVPRWLLRGPLAHLAGRHHPELADARVFAPSIAGTALSRLRRGSGAPASKQEVFEEHLQIGARFAAEVVAALRHERLEPGADAAFLYNTGALEVIEHLWERGVPSVVDQIDPGALEDAIVAEEAARWPGWEREEGRIPEAYFDRLREEWSAADRVVVNSGWSRDALIGEGVPQDKIFVLPLAYEKAAVAASPTPEAGDSAPRDSRPLRVLWLGQVNLRKGIAYLLEAARMLRDAPVQFQIAGPLGITAKATRSAPENVEFLGRIPREQCPAHYAAADVFVLPTLSDGFAITQIEALAHGVPVIATPCCGEVVRDGVDGLIVPPRDGPALAEALRSLIEDPARLTAMKEAAPEGAERFSMQTLARNLLELERGFGLGS